MFKIESGDNIPYLGLCKLNLSQLKGVILIKESLQQCFTKVNTIYMSKRSKNSVSNTISNISIQIKILFIIIKDNKTIRKKYY